MIISHTKILPTAETMWSSNREDWIPNKEKIFSSSNPLPSFRLSSLLHSVPVTSFSGHRQIRRRAENMPSFPNTAIGKLAIEVVSSSCPQTEMGRSQKYPLHRYISRMTSIQMDSSLCYLQDLSNIQK